MNCMKIFFALIFAVFLFASAHGCGCCCPCCCRCRCRHQHHLRQLLRGRHLPETPVATATTTARRANTEAARDTLSTESPRVQSAGRQSERENNKAERVITTLPPQKA